MRAFAFVAVSRPIVEMNEGCPRVEPMTALEKPKAAEPKQMKTMMNTNFAPKWRRPCSALAPWAVMVQWGDVRSLGGRRFGQGQYKEAQAGKRSLLFNQEQLRAGYKGRNSLIYVVLLHLVHFPGPRVRQGTDGVAPCETRCRTRGAQAFTRNKDFSGEQNDSGTSHFYPICATTPYLRHILGRWMGCPGVILAGKTVICSRCNGDSIKATALYTFHTLAWLNS